MKLGRILTIILITSAVLLISTTFYAGAVIMKDSTATFSESLSLADQQGLEISKHPVCTWYVPSLGGCYYGGLRPHSELSLVYHTRGMSRVLVVFELPGR